MLMALVLIPEKSVWIGLKVKTACPLGMYGRIVMFSGLSGLLPVSDPMPGAA